MGPLKVADFCRLLFLLSSLYLTVDAKSTTKVDVENEPEEKLLIRLLARIIEMEQQQKQENEFEADVSALTSRDKEVVIEKDSDKSLVFNVKDKDGYDNNGTKNNSTLEKFDNCEEDAGSEDQKLMDSFKIENNGTSHGTKCRKVKPQDKMHDSHKLSPDQQNSTKRNFDKNNFALWPKGIVQYVISSVFTEGEKKVMRTAFDEIESKTCIKLEPYNGVPMDPNLKAYINIVSEDGCWSYMGRINNPSYQPQKMSLQRDGCVYNAIVIHEVLHALGMTHEQSRQDRDKYLTIYFNNISKGRENINYRKFSTDDINDFDLESVMMYRLWNNGKKVMEPKQKDLSFLAGSATGLDFYDVKDITAAYSCTGHCKTTPSCQYAGFVNFKCECYCPPGIKGDKCTELETDKDCGGFIDVSNGPKTIQSPNYPKNYKVGQQCIWLVETTKGSHIRLNIADIHLSSGDKNCHHWLEVRYNMLGQTGRRICGNGKDQDVLQTTPDGNPNMMMLIFNSKKLDKATPSKGFKGTVSSFNIGSPCKPNPCQNGGKCSTSESQFKCSCSSGWSGKTCQVNACVPNPCKNGGQCSGTESQFTCSCSLEWIGSTCEVKANPCEPDPCQNGGQCSGSGSKFNCSCSSGWTGSTCEVEVNPCKPNPCQNGGQCSRFGSKFNCSCNLGWTGKTCKVKDPCHSHPCLNGGTCTDAGSSFSCICASGWLGKTCNLKDRCDFNSKDEKCFMKDAWMPGESDSYRFKHAMSSVIRSNGYIFLNSTDTGYELGELLSQPRFSPGQHCFSFNYYMYVGSEFGGAYINLSYDSNDVTHILNNKGKQWFYQHASLILKTDSTIILLAEVHDKAFVAFDTIRLVKGAC